jgi:hypothetical protein
MRRAPRAAVGTCCAFDTEELYLQFIGAAGRAMGFEMPNMLTGNVTGRAERAAP